MTKHVSLIAKNIVKFRKPLIIVSKESNTFQKKEQMQQKKAPATGTITISFSFLGIAFLLLTILIVSLFLIDYYSKIEIKLSEYLSIASFGCVTIGLLYNAISLQYNFQINKLKFEKETEAERNDKIKFTYEVTSTWWKSDMSSNSETAKRFITPYKGTLNQSAKLIEFKTKLESPEGYENRRSLIAILNYFENLSLLIEDGMIDEEILKKCFRTLFITYYHNLKEYIHDEQSGNSGGNSKIYINFVRLCKKWEQD